MARGRSSRGRSRGEVNEVINQLEHLSAMDGRRPDVVQSKRECFQKLIRYMTAGIDMSAVFIPATKCVALSKFDLPLKKMLYLYLRSAARQNEAVALLVVQTLLTDCKDADPTIRGLAVRSMCSLRVPDLMENVFSAVDVGLKDTHPYVREVSVVGVLKCYHQDATGTKLRKLFDIVRSMLNTDTDPQVAANCLYVLREARMLDESVVTKSLIVSLLNRIRSFSDWAQCLVLDVLLTWYRPESEAERFDMLEILDFGLNHTNSAVVLATAKLFLQYTAAYPEQYGRVLTSIKGPLQTILLGREPEVSYTVLANIVLLAERHQGFFSDLSSDLFCRPEDPSYLKLLKLDALVAVADASNAYDAAEEASQYARDPEEEIARAAVRAVARIALKVVEVDGILDRLLVFLTQHRHAVAGEAVAAMADVLRKFPDAAVACVPPVAEVDERALTRPESRAAYVWVLGEFGETLQDAPYLLEAMIEHQFVTTSGGGGGTNDTTSNNGTPSIATTATIEGNNATSATLPTSVKLALLTAITKLFFKRPPECQRALGMALSAGAQDTESSVRDRALLYYKLLQDVGVDAAKDIINAPKKEIPRFEDAQLAEVRDKIFDEWNTFSVIYRAPAASFIDSGVVGGERLEVDSIGDGRGDGSIGEGGGDGSDVDGGTALLLDLNSGGNTTGGGDVGVDSLSMGVESMSMLTMGGIGSNAAAMNSNTNNNSNSNNNVMSSLSDDIFGGMSSSGINSNNSIADVAAVQQQQQQSSSSLSFDMLGDLLGGTTTTMNTTNNTTQQQQQQPVSGHNLDDFMNSFMPTSTPPPPPPPQQQQQNTTTTTNNTINTTTIELKSQPTPIDASHFQSLWTSYQSSLSFTEDMSHSPSISTIESRSFRDFIDYIKQANIINFAQPKEGSSAPYRFLFYAQVQGSDEYVLSQVTVSKSPAQAMIEVKCGGGSGGSGRSGEHVKELLQTLMMTY